LTWSAVETWLGSAGGSGERTLAQPTSPTPTPPTKTAARIHFIGPF
jgi:hypothetical protein